MEDYFIRRPLKWPPIHPGEILREDVLQNLGLTVSEAARRLGVSRQQLHRILACTHPITTEMALKIGKFAGNGPGLWLRMQQANDFVDNILFQNSPLPPLCESECFFQQRHPCKPRYFGYR